MPSPRLLLLDEPAAGLNHTEVDELKEIILRVRTDVEVTILLVEHHMGFVMGISDQVCVLNFGQKIAEGPPAVVRRRPGRHRRLPRPAGGLRRRGVTGERLLRVERIDVAYGRLPALRGVSFEIAAGETVALLGSNGAGKSTVLKAVSGLLRPTAGSIQFAGEEIAGCRPSALVRRGLVHAAERRPLFGDFNVEENLRVGAYSPRGDGCRRPSTRRTPISPSSGSGGGSGPRRCQGGEQQMLVIARALMTKPRLLLLDEPSLGLGPLVVQLIYQQVGRISRERGLAVLLAEPNVDLALTVAAHGYVLETGSVVTSGTAEALRANDEVRQSYLGERVGAR